MSTETTVMKHFKKMENQYNALRNEDSIDQESMHSYDDHRSLTDSTSHITSWTGWLLMMGLNLLFFIASVALLIISRQNYRATETERNSAWRSTNSYCE
jgi:hypothetical protein